MTKEVKINDIRIGGENIFCLIAGPCVIENKEIVFNVAEKLKEICEKHKIPFIFKASYDKANRTSIKSYRGPGIEKGLEILNNLKQKLNISITTDVHCVTQIEKVAEVVDLLQIPAFLSRQTDLILEAGKTGKPVNIKKGQFLAPWDIKNIIEKFESTGNKNLLITERGVCFGYNNLVVDFTGIPLMRSYEYPIIFDATHSVQKPGGMGEKSGGNSQWVPYLAKAAVAVGVDGLFMEVHPEPEKALSDGPNMIKLQDIEKLLITLKKIYHAAKNE